MSRSDETFMQGAHTCWYSEVSGEEGKIHEAADNASRQHSPLPSLLALEQTIAQRKRDSETQTGRFSLRQIHSTA